MDKPKIGSPEWDLWSGGARREHELTVEGMTEKGEDFYDVVQILASQGRSPDEMTAFVATVYTCEWPLWKRLKLAWKIIKN